MIALHTFFGYVFRSRRARTIAVLVLALGVVSSIAPVRLYGQTAEAAKERAEAANVERLWAALGSEKNDVAEAAAGQLAEAPGEMLDLVERKLAPLIEDARPRIDNLIKQLDSDQYAQRESAQQQLAQLGRLAEPELRRALRVGLTLESKSRVQLLLNGMRGPFTRSAEDRRLVRLARLLKNIDTPRGDAILKIIAPAVDLTLVDSRFPPLYDLLDSELAAARAEGAVGLTQLGEAAVPALPRLIELLGDDGPHVTIGNWTRSVAGHVESALPTLGGHAVLPLIDALTNANTQVRSRAATVLGGIQDKRAIEPLMKRLTDAEYQVRSNANSALTKFGPQAVGPYLEALNSKDMQVRQQAAYALGEIRDERALGPLGKLLRDDDATLREYAIDSLRKFGAAAKDELIAALKSNELPLKGDGKLKGRIATVLGIIRHPSVVAPLMAATSDEHEEVRSAAVYWLSQQSSEALLDPRLSELVMAGMRDPSSMVRRTAASALQNLASYDTDIDRARVVDLLMAALDDSSREVQQSAIEALGNWRDRRAVDHLLRFLDDDPLHTFAAAALGQIGDPRAIPPLRRYLGQKDPRVISALGSLKDRESVEAIILLLNEKETKIQHAAADALGAIKDHRAVEPLIAALKGEERVMRRAAAHALGEIKDPRAVPPLIDACRSNAARRQFNFRQALDTETNPLNDPVAWPLLHIGLPTVEPLAQVLNDPSTPLREVAACVLYNLMGRGGLDADDMQPSVEPLVMALGDSSNVVRHYAAAALGKLKDPRAADVLLEMVGRADEPSFVYVNAALYLGNLREPKSFEPLVELLRSDRPKVRSAAARSLGLMGDRRAIEPLAAALGDSDPDVRVQSLNALASLRAPTAAESLIACLNNKDAGVRSAAAWSLGRLGDPRAIESLAKVADDDEFEVQLVTGIALVQLGDARGAPIVARCLTNANRHRPEDAVTAVSSAFLKNEVLVPPLAVTLSDPSSRVRLYAAGALGHIGSRAAADALLAKISDRENLHSILQGLGATKDDRALEALIEHLDDSDAAIRSIAVYQIGTFDKEQNVDRLVACLTDSSADVRLSAIHALTISKSKKAVDSLTTALQDDDPQVRVYAARALKRMKP